MQPSQIVPISKEDFNKQYWFNPYQNVTVINPKDQPMPFMAEGRHFIIEAGSKATFPGPIANVYLDMMARILAQDKDELGFMADPTLKKIYYDRLIVSVESTINEASSVPAYLRNVNPTNVSQAPTDRAPWDSTIGERASDVAPVPSVPPTSSAPSPVREEPVATEKEFEHEGNKYKFITAKNGNKMYYRNGTMISGAEYNKAASML